MSTRPMARSQEPGSQAVFRAQRCAVDPVREEQHLAAMEELRAAWMAKLLAERSGGGA